MYFIIIIIIIIPFTSAPNFYVGLIQFGLMLTWSMKLELPANDRAAMKGDSDREALKELEGSRLPYKRQ